MKKKHNISLGLSALVFVVTSCLTHSCTDVESEVYSNAADTNFPSTENEMLSLVGASYGTLRSYGNLSSIYSVNEASTDELVVPTRGSGWYDAGVWRQLAEHSWNPVSPPSIDGAWNTCYSGIANVNLILENLNSSSIEVDGKETIISELRAIRAFYYYILCDLFGNVPLITEDSPTGNIPQSTRIEIFNYIESELKAVLPTLSVENNTVTYGKMTQGFANGLLAKLYINAEVFTGNPRWTDCIMRCDAIIESDQYNLVNDYMDLFKVNNDRNGASKENIFVIPFDKTYAGGMVLYMYTLPPGVQKKYGIAGEPYGGFVTFPAFYQSFNDEDNRKRQWMVGPQYGNDGMILTLSDYVDGKTKDLIITVEIDSFGRAPLPQGVRSLKYEVQQNNPSTTSQDNDFAVLRYADVLLMKAEASLRLGDASTAVGLVNQIRQRAGLTGSTSLTLEELLAERGREFAWEGWRRNDLIRFGEWESDWNTPLKYVKRNEPYLRLYPIPSNQLSKNSLLKQNPGY